MKFMPKRDKNTSALGIALRMPSSTVIWLKGDIFVHQVELMLTPVIYFRNEFTK